MNITGFRGGGGIFLKGYMHVHTSQGDINGCGAFRSGLRESDGSTNSTLAEVGSDSQSR